MNRLSDQQLLRDYARQRSEAAFGQLVERHVDLVFSAARRMVPDAHLAHDVTQLVFLALARNAPNLLEHPFLSGWLHRTTRNLAAKAIRSEAGRRARELEAATMKDLLTTETEPAWEQLASELDLGIDRLRGSERDALLLRYFERRSAREMGAILGISEQAAQKRVNRAVERLRMFFARRGIAVGASGLSALLAIHAVEAAPAGLAATVSAAVSASVLLGGAATQTSVTMALAKAITMTTLQKAGVGAVLAVSIVGVWYQSQETAGLRRRLATIEDTRQRQTEQLENERDRLAAKVAALSAENDRHQTNLAEIARLRAELARLRARRQENLPAKTAAAPETTPQPAKLQIPKDNWVDAGLQTPEAALKTRGWCVVNGNRERFKDSVFITDGARKMLEDRLVQMAEQSQDPHKDQTIQSVLEHKLGVEEGILMPMTAENQQVGYTGYEVVSDLPTSDDERLLQIETTLANGSTKREDLKLHRFGADWKVVIDEDFVRAAH